MVLSKNKILALVSVCIFVTFVFYSNESRVEKKQDRQKKLIGEWVYVEGLCDKSSNPGKILGFDITPDFQLVENGHQQKIRNMDITTIDDAVGNCHFLESYDYQFEVAINTGHLTKYLYANPGNGFEILRKSTGERFFRLNPEFKNHYDQTVKELAKKS